MLKKTCRHWQQYEVRHIEERSDRRAGEITKARPWAVLSLDQLHRDEIFVACPDTTGERDGYSQEFLVRAPEARARLDLQQLWTFPAERETGEQKRAELREKTIGELANKLREHLRLPETNDVFGSLVGRVLWVDFVCVSGDPAQEADLFVVQQALARIGEPWEVPRAAQMSCVCIASDERERARGSRTISLATVVPLIHVPRFQAAFNSEGNKNPTVTVPLSSKVHAGQVRSALTRCLLTIDYDSEARGDRKRVYRGGEGKMVSWTVKPAELRAILEDVWTWLGLH